MAHHSAGSISRVNGRTTGFFGRLTEPMVTAMSVMTAGECRLWAALILCAYGKDVCSPSQQRLTSLTGLDLRALQRAMAALRDRGAIQVNRGPRGAITGYALNADFDHGENGISSMVDPDVPVTTLESGPNLQVSPTRVHARAYAREEKHLEKQQEKPQKRNSKTVAAPLNALQLSPPSEPSQLALAPPPEGVPEGVQRVFLAWQTATEQPAARLTDSRRKLIERSIRDYGLEDSMMAVRGVAFSDFHMGRHPKTQGSKRFADITTILEKPERIETMRQLAQENGLSGTGKDTVTTSSIDHFPEWMRLYKQFLDGLSSAPTEDCPPEIAERFDEHVRPDGMKLHMGERVLHFSEAFGLLTIHVGNAAAAKWAGAQLVSAHPNDPAAKEEADIQRKSVDADVRRSYADAVKKAQAEMMERAS